MEGYGYSDAWKAIIRPPRDEYSDEELGPSKFMISKKTFQRTDLDLKNERKQVLKCSFFEPVESERPAKELPCVIYLHGNSSSRVEAVQYVRTFLPSYITFFCFDFSGSGKSDGEYISLGWWEREDLKVVIEHLRKSGRVSTIGLWGRSMGAATALLHVDRDPSIAGLVLDSPFSSLTKLAEELYKKYASGVPGFIYSMAQWFVKRSIKSRADFALDDICPIKHVGQSFVPALFIVAKEDDFIVPAHGLELYEKYSGDKNLIQVDGDHNSPRPAHAITSAYIFFFNTLQVSQLLPGVVSQAEENLVTKYVANAHPVPKPVAVSGNVKHQTDYLEDEETIQMILKLSLETAEEEHKKRDTEPKTASSTTKEIKLQPPLPPLPPFPSLPPKIGQPKIDQAPPLPKKQ